MIAVMRPLGEVVCSPFFQPCKVRLKLFFHWGIQFGEPYTAPERGNRKVTYANKVELVEAILAKYGSVAKILGTILENAISQCAHHEGFARGRAAGAGTEIPGRWREEFAAI